MAVHKPMGDVTDAMSIIYTVYGSDTGLIHIQPRHVQIPPCTDYIVGKVLKNTEISDDQ